MSEIKFPQLYVVDTTPSDDGESKAPLDHLYDLIVAAEQGITYYENLLVEDGSLSDDDMRVYSSLVTFLENPSRVATEILGIPADQVSL